MTVSRVKPLKVSLSLASCFSVLIRSFDVFGEASFSVAMLTNFIDDVGENAS